MAIHKWDNDKGGYLTREDPTDLPSTEQVDNFKSIHAGIIHITTDSLLHWLRFDRGNIRNIRMHEFLDGIEILIEHPDMPEVKVGEAYQIVNPSYKVDYQEGQTKITRIPFTGGK